MIMIGRGGNMMGFGIVVGDGKGCSDSSSYYTGMWRDMVALWRDSHDWICWDDDVRCWVCVMVRYGGIIIMVRLWWAPSSWLDHGESERFTVEFIICVG